MTRPATLLIALLCVVGSAGDTSYQSASAAVIQAAAASSAMVRESIEIVLLNNGQTLRGVVTKTTDAVTVQTPGGSRIVVPVSQVDRCCTSLADAYQRRADKIPASDIAGHESLLHWCLKHQLRRPAQQQLTTLMQTKLSVRRLSYLDERIRATFAPIAERDIAPTKLTLQPGTDGLQGQFAALPPINHDTRSKASQPAADAIYASTNSQAYNAGLPILPGPKFAMRPKKIVSPLPTQPASKSIQPDALQPSHPADNLVRPVSYAEPIATPRMKPARSLSPSELDSMTRRMPRDERHQFQRRIQPILLRGCNAAACHAPTDAMMPLMQRGRGQLVPKRMSQRNLSQALALISADSPETSPLLTAATTAHGDAKKPALKRDSKEYALLQAWVLAVAANAPDLLPAPQTTPRLLKPKAAEQATGSQPSTPAPTWDDDKPAQPRALPTPAQDSSSRDAADDLVGPPADPFDPELFNRQ